MENVKSLKEYQLIPKNKRKFYYLETRAMDDVKVSENGEKIEKFKNNYENGVKIFFEPTNEYAARITVIKKIVKASKYLPEGVYFMLYSGFRPIEVQQRLFDEIEAEIKNKNPDLEGEALWDEVTRFIADPKGTPPHSTGGAIDLTLCNSQGEELDMGTKVDDIDNIPLCATFAENISDEAKQNRKILFDAMEKVGMVNLPTEWWHYSYGDRYWAAYNDLDETLYSARSEKECPGNYTR